MTHRTSIPKLDLPPLPKPDGKIPNRKSTAFYLLHHDWDPQTLRCSRCGQFGAFCEPVREVA